MRKLILIAEDEFALAEVVAQMLSDSGHDVDLAVNGEVALARMAVRAPDLLLVDVMMPRLDGPGLLRRMREEPGLAAIPVVLMTALPRSVPQDIAPMTQAILVKPFTPNALMSAVGSALSRE